MLIHGSDTLTHPNFLLYVEFDALPGAPLHVGLPRGSFGGRREGVRRTKAERVDLFDKVRI